ncbi:MAG: FapA family protein [Spirochaetia bacterium]|nr:FapA family protein [Spirochaetia bacterium]
MDKLKQALMESDAQAVDLVKDKVEVVGGSIGTCLARAASYLGQDAGRLDYEILERGKATLFKKTPYRLLVSILPPEERFADLEEFSIKLGVGDRMLSEELDHFVAPKHMDGRCVVRIYRSGVYITVFPPLGQGLGVDLETALLKVQQSGISNFNQNSVEKAVRAAEGEPTRIGDYTAKPENDSSCKVEISPDEMKAIVRITAPKLGGRHLEVNDVVNALKAHGVVIGFKEDVIRQSLIEDRYMQDIVAAEGVAPLHGPDATIEYKVSIKKTAHLEQDDTGKVDFKNLNLVENVVAGQILAVKLPAKKGVAGRTLTNRIVLARDGKDTELRQGKGTILSDDKTKLIAEINGQVVYSNLKLSVEPVYRVVGDVGPKTGNIMFLGSVVIGGSVLDNFEVKAAGNVDVHGSVGKARIEAEGDVIVKQGILGREGAFIESTGGSVFAKFIQSAEVNVAEDVIVQEGILHSKVEAGGKVVCNGRRAQIVGGIIRAKKEVRARMIGSPAYTATEITVGTDPRVLKQHEELKALQKDTEDKLSRTKKSLITLQARQKADPENFAPAQLEQLQKNEDAVSKLAARSKEITEEMSKLDEYMNQLSAQGKVHIEKEVFPNVTVSIRNAAQSFSDTYRAVTLTFENGVVKFNKLEKAEEVQGRGGRKK